MPGDKHVRLPELAENKPGLLPGLSANLPGLFATCLQTSVCARIMWREKGSSLLWREKGSSQNSAFLTPELRASSVYVHVLEAPSPHERLILVMSLIPSPAYKS